MFIGKLKEMWCKHYSDEKLDRKLKQSKRVDDGSIRYDKYLWSEKVQRTLRKGLLQKYGIKGG